MRCTQCGKDTAIINSRPANGRTVTWRQRKCLSCGTKFQTVERVITADDPIKRIWDGAQA